MRVTGNNTPDIAGTRAGPALQRKRDAGHRQRRGFVALHRHTCTEHMCLVGHACVALPTPLVTDVYSVQDSPQVQVVHPEQLLSCFHLNRAGRRVGRGATHAVRRHTTLVHVQRGKAQQRLQHAATARQRHHPHLPSQCTGYAMGMPSNSLNQLLDKFGCYTCMSCCLLISSVVSMLQAPTCSTAGSSAPAGAVHHVNMSLRSSPSGSKWRSTRARATMLAMSARKYGPDSLAAAANLDSSW